MPISDFLGADAGYRLRARQVIPFGGGLLELRPISLGEFFQLWGALSAWLPAWEKMVRLGEEGVPFDQLDKSWEGPCFRKAFEIIWPDRSVDQFDLASAEEMQRALDWYIQEHSWLRILGGVFGCLGGQVGEEGLAASRISDDEALDRLHMIEIMGGRSIETILSMRPEAAIEYLRSFWRIKKEQLEIQRATANANQGAPASRGDGARVHTVRGLTFDHLVAMAGGMPPEGDN